MYITLIIGLLFGPAADLPSSIVARTGESRAGSGSALLEAHAAYSNMAPFSLARTAPKFATTAPDTPKASGAQEDRLAGCDS